MAKIGWDDKETFLPQPVPEINKFTADNANEAKDSVNDLYDIVDGLIDDVAAILIDVSTIEGQITTIQGNQVRSDQTQSEAVASAAAPGDVSATRVMAERGIFWFWAHVKTLAQTFAGKLTLTLNPRLSGTTASTFLGVDANKDLVSRAEATQAEMITGTSQTAVATPKSVEDKGSVKSRTISNGATGSTNIDCLTAQQIKARYTTTVTGAITITKSNDTNLEILNIAVPITGASIAITFPSDTRMERAQESLNWAQSTKILTVSAIGTADIFEFSLMRVGSVFELRYGGRTEHEFIGKASSTFKAINVH